MITTVGEVNRIINRIYKVSDLEEKESRVAALLNKAIARNKVDAVRKDIVQNILPQLIVFEILSVLLFVTSMVFMVRRNDDMWVRMLNVLFLGISLYFVIIVSARIHFLKGFLDNM